MTNIVIRNRYRIIQFLGSGSFGDTYIAEDLDLPGYPKCVVKQLKPKTSEQEVLLVARRLFDSEAEALYRLGNLSNQIPKLFAHFEENGEFYLVQEFIDGYDLSAEIIPGSQWSESQVIKLLQEILQVLTVVHQENIIHRDIKPQNLIRPRDDGKIVLIDFGAVKEIKGLSANTQEQVNSTIAIGSNGYMPNEQANSKPKLCSDIYAVGVIGIQALTGKLPQHFQEDPMNGEIIWQHEANVSDKLADVLTKMVRYNFSQRYQSAGEALQALNRLTEKSKFPLIPLKFDKWLAVGMIMAVCAIGIGLFVFWKSPSFYYQKLEAALKEKDWEKADEITYKLMLRVAGRESEADGRFNLKEWAEFSCADLQKIDSLWSNASGKKLGFTSQKKVLEDKEKDYSQFYVAVKWKEVLVREKWLVAWKYYAGSKKVEYLQDETPQFGLGLEGFPEGYLPAKLEWEPDPSGKNHDNRWQRIDDCELHQN